MSSEHSEQEQSLREQVKQSERVLDDRESDLRSIDAELEGLAQRNHQYELLAQVCRSLEELDDLGATHLFWGEQGDSADPVEHLHDARRNIADFAEEIARVEEVRRSIIDKINDQNDVLDYLHYDLCDAIEREESRKQEWLVERDIEDVPYRAQVMPWARGCEEDKRFRKSLGASLAASIMIALLVGSIALPIMDRQTVNELP